MDTSSLVGTENWTSAPIIPLPASDQTWLASNPAFIDDFPGWKPPFRSGGYVWLPHGNHTNNVFGIVVEKQNKTHIPKQSYNDPAIVVYIYIYEPHRSASSFWRRPDRAGDSSGCFSIWLTGLKCIWNSLHSLGCHEIISFKSSPAVRCRWMEGWMVAQQQATLRSKTATDKVASQAPQKPVNRNYIMFQTLVSSQSIGIYSNIIYIQYYYQCRLSQW